jgi:lysophospholipid hydrolase
MVQVFAQTGAPAEDQKGSWDNEDLNGYQLLNEVGSGGTLSSLFTILSLFTEDVKMSWQDGELPEQLTHSPGSISGFPVPPIIRSRRADSDVSQLNLDSKSKSHVRRSSAASSTSTIHGEKTNSSHSSPSLYVTASDVVTPRIPSFVPLHARNNTLQPTRIHHGVVARATEDTTLAVIPAEAFRRLTKNFPKATGHIVQGAFICWLGC